MLGELVKGKFPVVKYLFRKEFPVLEEALVGLSFESLEAQTPRELSEILSKAIGGLVLFSLHEKKDLLEIASVLKSLRSTLKETPFKAVIINYATGRSLEEKALQVGVQDLISANVSQKVLNYKLDFWLRTLKVLTRPPESHFLSLVDIEQDLTERGDVQWLNPLHIENDIWILKSTTDLKKNQNQWTVRLLGPGPLVGEWIELESERWSFQFSGPEKTRFLSNSGSWFYEGKIRPEFIGSENRWMFQGESFELYCVQEKEKISWMNIKDGVVSLRKNSPFALVKEDLIKDSFNQEIIKSWAFEENFLEKLDSFLVINENFYSCRFDDYFDGEIVLQMDEDQDIPFGEGVFFGPIPRLGKHRLKGRTESLENGFLVFKLDQSSTKVMDNLSKPFSEIQDSLDEKLKRMKGL